MLNNIQNQRMSEVAELFHLSFLLFQIPGFLSDNMKKRELESEKFEAIEEDDFKMMFYPIYCTNCGKRMKQLENYPPVEEKDQFIFCSTCSLRIEPYYIKKCQISITKTLVKQGEKRIFNILLSLEKQINARALALAKPDQNQLSNMENYYKNFDYCFLAWLQMIYYDMHSLNSFV